MLTRTTQGKVDRRGVMLGMAALGGTLVVGCSKQNRTPGDAGPPERLAPAIPAGATAMKVIRNPDCGCCEAWADMARKAGFEVTMTEEADSLAVKRRYGVPEQLASCHTALVGGYAVEGHVPIAAVQRLLSERPSIKGIAVPGMPVGSPGMEVPDGTKAPFAVLAFDSAGKIAPFGV